MSLPGKSTYTSRHIVERVIPPGGSVSVCQTLYLWEISLAEQNRKIQNDSSSEKMQSCQGPSGSLFFYF